jgi:hypothetical protein
VLIKARGNARKRNGRASDVRWQESSGQALLCYPRFV